MTNLTRLTTTFFFILSLLLGCGEAHLDGPGTCNPQSQPCDREAPMDTRPVATICGDVCAQFESCPEAPNETTCESDCVDDHVQKSDVFGPSCDRAWRRLAACQLDQSCDQLGSVRTCEQVFDEAEEACTTPTTDNCPKGHTACGDGSCIRYESLCDDRSDCADESDEESCG